MSIATSSRSTSRWPGPEALHRMMVEWARRTADGDPTLVRIGYAGPFDPHGSDAETHLDVVLVVEEIDLPPAERGSRWDLDPIPVPNQALVYTPEEWSRAREGNGWLARKLREETVWVHER